VNSKLFKRHRFSPEIILLAVRWYCRYPLSYSDVSDLLAERGIHVNRATIHRWVIKFGPVVARKTRAKHSPRSMMWHVDETYIRVSGKWRYLWRIVDEHGRFVDFRLTARRNANAAKAFLKAAQEKSGLYPPATIIADKAPTYPAIVKSMGIHAYFNKPVAHICNKGDNNRIESDHAALKRIVAPAKGYQKLHTAKATLQGIEAFRTIKRGDIDESLLDASGEVRLVNEMFGLAA